MSTEEINYNKIQQQQQKKNTKCNKCIKYISTELDKECL